MGDKSAIEWTNATWNAITGCDKVSPGCKYCYAERYAPRAETNCKIQHADGNALYACVSGVWVDYLS